MRVSTGLGLFVIVGMFACGTTADSRGGFGSPDDESTTDGDEPGGSGNGKGSSKGSSDSTEDDAAPSALVENLEITGIAVLQGVKVDVVKAGSLVARSKRNAPVVAKRPGLLRVYVKPGSGWDSQEVTAEVRFVNGSTKRPVLRDKKTIKAVSKDEDINSTLNIEFDADDLAAGTKFQVVLTGKGGAEVADGEESSARFPADGTLEDLGAEISGKLKVVVVPVKYDADGSGRSPDVSKAQLDRYKNTLMKMYPTSEVELTARQPYSWTQSAISRNGAGFSNVLQAMYNLRRSDRVDDDVYYYGVFSPASSMMTFCSAGCVAGLSTVGEENAPMMRASVGLGFNGQQSANTMAHELGHAHGREHAPCGDPDGVDRSYPYAQAAIGVWGYDIFAKTLISPTKGRDIMAYCPNEWVSDYTYGKLFDRIQAVATEKSIQNASAQSSTSSSQAAHWQMASVGADGSLSWDSDDVDFTAEPKGGSLVKASFLNGSGAEVVKRDARFFRFDHLPGGIMFVPRESAAAWKSVKIDGFRDPLVRRSFVE